MPSSFALGCSTTGKSQALFLLFLLFLRFLGAKKAKKVKKRLTSG
jgi:hypothetical protein